MKSFIDFVLERKGKSKKFYKNYAYVPDKSKPSTWKLRIDDPVHTKLAVAALGKGFRGNKVSIPYDDLQKVKSKVRKAYKKYYPDKDIPQSLKD